MMDGTGKDGIAAEAIDGRFDNGEDVVNVPPPVEAGACDCPRVRAATV